MQPLFPSEERLVLAPLRIARRRCQLGHMTVRLSYLDSLLNLFQFLVDTFENRQGFESSLLIFIEFFRRMGRIALDSQLKLTENT